ncbi:TonB-dependent siderophore receptor [Achromobacter sp. Marseille-Q0513]|uniref:TonB-dependent siderophore receptor n=1 Tax=Achromobacter sp. Marseille-Q0513 TaxID=2829161 RepID=UPI001B941995|nr:TonB-dependent siderophore receptor [Achromobacter sp. Marseille-Q0513]MBR8653599.1 TonB-dependent siderophore receptor [Achromobacter sp. Marseille-Q0513]
MNKPLHQRAARAVLALAAGLPFRLAASGAALALACAGVAQAQTAARTYAIPAGTLESVLSRYAVDSGLMLSYSAGDIAGKRSTGLAGSHAAPAALARILAGTGLEALPQPNGGYVLRPQPTGRNEAPTLAPVTVSGAGLETAYGPVQGFVARRSAAATKTDTPLHETPQSVAVVSRDQMVAQAADSLDQALGYTAGVLPLEGGGLRNIGTRFTVRGFNITGAAPLYQNGAKFPINSLSGGIEPYLYERVELLKGPASILYGQAAPGGIINLVTKLPTAEPLRELELQAGSWNKKQIAADFGGPLSEDGRVRYRLTGLARDSDTMVRRIDNDRAALAGALAWQLTDATTLTLLASYNRIRNPYDAGKPLDGTLLSNPNGRIARDRYLGEPGSDHFDVTGATYGYMLEHKFNDSWQFRQNLMAYDYKADNKYTEINSRVFPANPRLVGRSIVGRHDTDKGLAVDNQLIGKLRHGAFEHTLLFGADWSTLRWTRSQKLAPMPPIDLYDPVYGSPVVFNPAYDRRISQQGRQLGFYAQDQIKIDGRWIVLLGGRYDKARNDSGAGPQDSHAFTPRAGLMYLFDNGLAPYYSYSKSFQPTAGADFNGNPFRPTTGVQHEVGLKYEPPGADASVTLALYDITQRNVLTSDPAHTGFLSQSGEVRSRGAEIEARASLNRQWDLLASFALIDAEVTKSNHGTQGTRPPSVPNNMATLWADYRFSGVPGLSAGFGVRHVGRQETNRMPVPSYTTYDAALRYQWEKWQFALNIKNLTDKTYVSACPGVCYYGDERNITLTARLNW